jgi:hypothetical protein
MTMPNWKSVAWDRERCAREEQERVDAIVAENARSASPRLASHWSLIAPGQARRR